MLPIRDHICAEALTSYTCAVRMSGTDICKSYNVTDLKPKLSWDRYFILFEKLINLLPSSVCDSIPVTGFKTTQ